MTKTESAETVRRFLAKAYPPEHPAFAALERLAVCDETEVAAAAFRTISHICKHPADASYLPRKTTASPNTLHGGFGAMEGVSVKATNWE